MPGYHLWFLPALASAVVIFALLRHRLGWCGLFALSIALYGAGMVLDPWRALISFPAPPFNPRNGPFFALLFVTLGAWMRGHPLTPGRRWAPVIALAALLQVAEAWLLVRENAIPALGSVNFTVATILYGWAVFAAAIEYVPSALLTRASVGVPVLGMYVIHPVFVSVGQRIIAPTDLTIRLGHAVFAFIASLIVAVLLARLPLFRRIVA